MAQQMTSAAEKTVQLQTTDTGYALHGYLDNQRSMQVYKALPEANGDTLHLNLSKLEKVDSAGLALLVLWANRQRTQGGALKLNNVPAQAKQMMGILDLNSILDR